MIFTVDICRKHKLSAIFKPYGKCPVTMRKNWRRYMVTISQGKALTLQAEKSDVSLHVPDGIHAVLKGCVHTDHSRFIKAIPPDECIVAPMVEFHDHPIPMAPIHQPTKPQYIVRIPHCVPDESDWEYIWVRSGDIHGDNIFTDIEKYKEKGNQETYYKIDEEFITIYTTHFTNYCVSCKRSFCSNLASCLLFGSVRVNYKAETLAMVQPFFCSLLYNIQDYREVSIKYLLINYNLPLYNCINYTSL